MGRENRGPRVAILEAADFLFQLTFQTAWADAAALGDEQQVSPLVFENGQQQVFEIDLVVPAGHAQAGGPLGGLTAGVVKFADQGFQGGAHYGGLFNE